MKVRQKISDWIEDQHSTKAEFARAIDCTDGYVALLLQGERGASWDTAKKIEAVTNGKISAVALIEEKPAREAAQ